MGLSAEKVTALRSSLWLTIIAFGLPLFLTVWQYDVVTRGADEWLDDVIQSGVPISDVIKWWVQNGYLVSGAIVAPFVGFYVNFFSTKSLCIAINLLTAVFVLVYAITLNLVTIIVSQLALGCWGAATFVCALSYFCRISSLANRTKIVIGVYFVIVSISPSLIQAFREALGHCPSAPLGGFVLFGFLILSSILLALIQEQPVSLQLGDLVDEQSSMRTLSAGLSRFFSRRGVMSVPAVMACMYLIVSCQFGYSVYSDRLSDTIVTGFSFSLDAQRGFVYGLLGATVLVAVLLWVVVRWVSDRRLLLICSFVMLTGYLLVISWGTWSAARFVSGAALITLSDCVVMAIGTALFSKVVTPAFMGIWIGILKALQLVAQILAFVWCKQTGEAPFEATLGIIGLGLILMIPVYKFLLPQLYSPWSGSGMPAKVTADEAEKGIMSGAYGRTVVVVSPRSGVLHSALHQEGALPAALAAAGVAGARAVPHGSGGTGSTATATMSSSDYHSLD